MEILYARCYKTSHKLKPAFEVRSDPSDLLTNFRLFFKLRVDERLLLFCQRDGP